MTRFDAPGFLDDFSEEQLTAWSDFISAHLNRAKRGSPSDNDGPRGQFFNALDNPPAADAQVAVIAWNAFPRQIRTTSASDRQRWRRADASRDVQDEYCEWSVTRDASGKIIRITFTCEGPEYWSELARVNPDKVVELYRTHVSPSITRADVFSGGVYNPRNRFNNGTSNGAMHLIQVNNTLGAEIELAAAATIRRLRDGAELTDAQALIRCSLYGAAGRNSDPFIGEQVNALARQRADITLNNPIGLYLHEFNPVGWTTPDGADPRDFMKFTRGKAGHSVRAVFEVPAERGYTVGDIKAGGRRIEFGAQVVDFLTIKLEGLATRIGQSTVAPFTSCHAAAGPSLAGVGLGIAALTPEAQAVPASTRTTAASVAIEPEIDEEALKARLPDSLRLDEPEAGGLTIAALLNYPPLAPELLAPRMVNGRVLAYASPDSTFFVTKKLIDSARRSVVIGIYDFSASHMFDLLKRAMNRGVQVTIMLDTNSSGEDRLFERLEELGATCVESPSSSAGNPRAFFPNAHEKIIVVDGEIVMIQSGNWSGNSIPFNEGDGEEVGEFQHGNRDMGIAIHSRDLAQFFAGLVARDIRLSKGEAPGGLLPAGTGIASLTEEAATAVETFFEAAPSEVPQLFSSLSLPPGAPFQVTPVLSPENYIDVARAFLRSAKRTILIEQQYIRGNQATIRELLDAIAEAREERPELEVRVIVSLKFLDRNQRRNFEDAMTERGLEFDENFRYLSLRHFVHCHNKLIVVDGEKALIGSQNWSTTAVSANREASLLIENPAVAGYFAEIFEADWELSEPEEGPGIAFAEAVEGLRQPSQFAEGGVVESTVRDYVDV